MKPYPKLHPGRRGIPHAVVKRMHKVYRRVRSLRLAEPLLGRTRQSLWELFKTHNLPLAKRRWKNTKTFNGRKFFHCSYGWRESTRTCKRGRETLHRAIWIHHHGPIPAGHQVYFKDGNRENFDPANLACGPKAMVSAIHATGQNGHTKKARREFEAALSKFNK